MAGFIVVYMIVLFACGVLSSRAQSPRMPGCVGATFYHDVGGISDLSQSEAPNLVM